MSVRGIRGATTADENTSEAILDATTDLLRHMVEANGTQIEDMSRPYTSPSHRTSTPSSRPWRRAAWAGPAWRCSAATEIPVPGSQDRCIRVLMLVNSETARRKTVQFVYLKDAANLRDRGMKDEVQSLAAEE